MVDRDVVKGEVEDTLYHVARLPIRSEKLDLREDLMLSPILIEGLAVTWTKLSQRHGGARVSRVDAAQTETVGDVIDLVFERSNASTD